MSSFRYDFKFKFNHALQRDLAMFLAFGAGPLPNYLIKTAPHLHLRILIISFKIKSNNHGIIESNDQ